MPKDAVEIMALLNALFPTVVHIQDSQDFDPTPYTPGLRDSLRLVIFEHLMGDGPFSPRKQEIIKMKLLQWCGVPDYEEARATLSQYMWESKAFQGLCFQLLNDVNKVPSIPDSLAREISKRFNDPQPSASGGGPTQRVSSASGAQTPSAKKAPGRELLAATTNLAAFSNNADPGGPSNASPATDSDKDEFHQHPLVAHLNMTTAEKESLGLMVPKVAPPQIS